MFINHVLRILYRRPITAYDVQSSSAATHCTPPPPPYSIYTRTSPLHPLFVRIYMRLIDHVGRRWGGNDPFVVVFFFSLFPPEKHVREHFSAFQIVTIIYQNTRLRSDGVKKKKIWKNLIISIIYSNGIRRCNVCDV